MEQFSFKHAPPGLGKVISSPALMFSITTPCHHQQRQRQRQRQRTISQVIEQKKCQWLPWLTITSDKDWMMITRSYHLCDIRSCVLWLPSILEDQEKRMGKTNKQKILRRNFWWTVSPQPARHGIILILWRTRSVGGEEEEEGKKGSQVATTYIQWIVRKKERERNLFPRVDTPKSKNAVEERRKAISQGW